MVVEDEAMPISMEIPSKSQAEVDYYIDRGPSAAVGKESRTGQVLTVLHDRPPTSPD